MPDSILMDPGAPGTAVMVWQPGFTCIVLGASNRQDNAVYQDLAAAEGIPVFKRPSGGQTVLLSPLTLVISIRFFSDSLDHPRIYFGKINRIIISALGTLGINNVVEKGISDLAIGDKKILGSSIYRKKEMVFYHAVLNVSESPDRIARLLKHPVREPDYRAGRSHGEFITSLQHEGCRHSLEEIRKRLTEHLAQKL